MTGYNYAQGMSNNAVDAYDRGVMPLSKIEAHHLSIAGWHDSKKLATTLAKSGFWPPAEWHHSSGYFNKVKFYNPATLVRLWGELTSQERSDLKENQKQKPQQQSAKRVRGSYVVWGGSRRRPKKLHDQEFTGTLSGNWITLDSGGRKKATGRYISYQEI